MPTLSTYNEDVRKFKIVTITGQTGVFMLTHHVSLNNYLEVSKATGLGFPLTAFLFIYLLDNPLINNIHL